MPPDAVTSYTVEAVTSLTDSVAVAPLTAKSAGSTFATSSLNVTRQVRLFALVGVDAGLRRSIESTRGAVVSTSVMFTVALAVVPTAKPVGRLPKPMVRLSPSSSSASATAVTVRVLLVCDVLKTSILFAGASE